MFKIIVFNFRVFLPPKYFRKPTVCQDSWSFFHDTYCSFRCPEKIFKQYLYLCSNTGKSFRRPTSWSRTLCAFRMYLQFFQEYWADFQDIFPGFFYLFPWSLDNYVYCRPKIPRSPGYYCSSSWALLEKTLKSTWLARKWLHHIWRWIQMTRSQFISPLLASVPRQQQLWDYLLTCNDLSLLHKCRLTVCAADTDAPIPQYGWNV